MSAETPNPPPYGFQTVFYGSNVNDSRDPFTYFLNGNLNLGIYNWSLPISYSFTKIGRAHV